MKQNFLDNVELFNVAEVRESKLGYILSRFPEEIYKDASSYGAMVVNHADNCELRFVKEENDSLIRVTFMAEYYPAVAVVMRGDRAQSVYKVEAGQIKTIEIGSYAPNGLKENPEFFKNDTFSKEVVRIIFTASKITLCDIETFGKKIRPPKKEELPQKTFLAYGSSVTHGAHAFSSTHSYIATTARLLKAQALNKGMGGSCFMEKHIADWITSLQSDFFIFEPGTNMYGEYENDVILKRGLYVLDKYFEKHPDNYIFMLEPPMPYQRTENPEKFKKHLETIRKMKAEIKNDKCVLFDINDIEKDTAYVMTDHIHPSTEGHIMMGMNLAELIKKYL